MALSWSHFTRYHCYEVITAECLSSSTGGAFLDCRRLRCSALEYDETPIGHTDQCDATILAWTIPRKHFSFATKTSSSVQQLYKHSINQAIAPSNMYVCTYVIMLNVYPHLFCVFNYAERVPSPIRTAKFNKQLIKSSQQVITRNKCNKKCIQCNKRNKHYKRNKQQ